MGNGEQRWNESKWRKSGATMRMKSSFTIEWCWSSGLNTGALPPNHQKRDSNKNNRDWNKEIEEINVIAIPIWSPKKTVKRVNTKAKVPKNSPDQSPANSDSIPHARKTPRHPQSLQGPGNQTPHNTTSKHCCSHTSSDTHRRTRTPVLSGVIRGSPLWALCGPGSGLLGLGGGGRFRRSRSLCLRSRLYTHAKGGRVR